MDLYLDNNYLSCGKTGPLCLALVGLMAGRLADEIWQDFEIIKILYWLEFYFVDINAMLLIVLEMHFSLLFSNKTGIVYIRVCFWCIKFGHHFFHVDPYYSVIAYIMITVLT